jgi:hypothetical protein
LALIVTPGEEPSKSRVLPASNARARKVRCEPSVMLLMTAVQTSPVRVSSVVTEGRSGPEEVTVTRVTEAADARPCSRETASWAVPAGSSWQPARASANARHTSVRRCVERMVSS